MRPIHLTDLDAAVRSVLQLPPTARRDRLAIIVTSADIADRYRKRLRKPHPIFGTGTLESASGGSHMPARFCDAHYRACLRDLLDALDARKRHHSAWFL